jgi:tRNA dimethylallyltransferase
MSLDSKPAAEAPLLFLVGPTAVGKSEAAVLLAERVGGEIISVDSMQVYRGLDIGTAKPSAAERSRIRHHLIDIIGLGESFDAGQFVKFSREAASNIHAEGHVPIFCGGTGLYFKALLEGLGDAPPADNRLRAELEATPLVELLRELGERDPTTYASIDRNNPRRVIRAVEVVRLTGKPFSEQRAQWGHTVRQQTRDAGGAQLPGPVIGLARSSADLSERIHLRVDDMFRRGLVEETKQLLEAGLAQNRTAFQALGYRQITEYLQGVRSLPETIELVKTRTRQYAKRQMTWFRRQLAVQWIHLTPTDTRERIADQIERIMAQAR